MGKSVRLALALFVLSLPCWAGTPCILDFRATSGFVTDPTNGVPITLTTTTSTPVSSGACSVTVKWATAPGTRDRLNTNDARLAGIAFVASAGGIEFLISGLTAGTYTLNVAMGDGGSSQCTGTTCTLKFNDGSGGTTLLTVTNGGTQINTNTFVDASSTVRTAAAWPGSNTPENVTITGTTLSVVLTSGSAVINIPIANISITPIGGGATLHTLSTLGAGPS